jgi:hypothetical protein
MDYTAEIKIITPDGKSAVSVISFDPKNDMEALDGLKDLIKLSVDKIALDNAPKFKTSVLLNGTADLTEILSILENMINDVYSVNSSFNDTSLLSYQIMIFDALLRVLYTQENANEIISKIGYIKK